ncbi:MAG: DUF5693 family protein [Bacillota bacterium]
MKKGLITVLILIAIIASVFSLYQRFQVEEKNKNVDLVFDIRQLQELNNNEEKLSFNELQKNNVSGIAVYEDDLQYLKEKKDLRVIKGEELLERKMVSDIKDIYESFPYDSDSAFLIFEGENLSERAKNLSRQWEKLLDLKLSSTKIGENEENLLIFFPEWGSEYLSLSLGFDSELISKIEESGLKVIPRLINNENSYSWDDKNDQLLLEDLSADYTIFAGDAISGHDINLAKTAEILENNDIKFAMIEPFIARQKGAASIGHLLEYDLLRVHSIEQDEMEKYNLEKVVDRYLRAVRERDVRILYLKPFLETKDDLEIGELNKKFLSELETGLKDDGFSLGKANSFDFFANSALNIYLISLGIAGAGIILLEKLIGFKLKKSFYLLIFLVLISVTGFIYLNKIMFLRKLLALGSSVIFPSLAIITQFLDKNDNYLKAFGKAILISLTGALMMAASLSHLSFLAGIDKFRGVKVAFLLPLILVIWYYLRREFISSKSLKENYQLLKDFLNYKIKIKDVLIVGFLGLAAIIYLARSGNYSFIPVLDIESLVREFLEDILYVRPRFKSFLIGHPILLLGLYYKEKIKSFILMIPALVLATIGQITVINTFAHIHIPLKISLIRSFHGVWLGLLIGMILIYLLRLLDKGRERWLLDD